MYNQITKEEADALHAEGSVYASSQTLGGANGPAANLLSAADAIIESQMNR
jgi:hypothetical protein